MRYNVKSPSVIFYLEPVGDKRFADHPTSCRKVNCCLVLGGGGDIELDRIVSPGKTPDRTCPDRDISNNNTHGKHARGPCKWVCLFSAFSTLYFDMAVMGVIGWFGLFYFRSLVALVTASVEKHNVGFAFGLFNVFGYTGTVLDVTGSNNMDSLPLV